MDVTLRKYRHRYRFWRNDARLRREFAEYRAAFLKKGLRLPDEREIREAMACRFPALKAKTKGELHIIALYHHYNWENFSLRPALERFGTVQHYDWFSEFDHQREKEWHGKTKEAMNRKLVEIVAGWHQKRAADVIFTYLSGELVSSRTMYDIRSLGVPLVNLSLNDKENFVGKVRKGEAMGMRDICPCFDLCWTSTEDALVKYAAAGALPFFLPEGANPEIHKPHDLEKIFDLSFVGQCYGNRPETIHRLEAAGVRVATFGYGWPSGPLPVEDMVRVYSQSRINLGFGGVSGHGATYCLKGRDFEVPMSGGLYLTEYHRELEKVYDLEKEIVTYRSFEELLARIRYLLAHPGEAEDIRKKGFRRATSEHTWERRFEKVFTLMGLIH